MRKYLAELVEQYGAKYVNDYERTQLDENGYFKYTKRKYVYECNHCGQRCSGDNNNATMCPYCAHKQLRLLNAEQDGTRDESLS